MSSKNNWKAWLYLAPAIVILLIFTLWPILNTFKMALLKNYEFMDEKGGATFEFGFGNFWNAEEDGVLQYHQFGTCLSNTVILCVLTVPISTMLALVIAVALNSIKFIKKTMQTIFFLPYVTNSIAIGMVFAAMFSQIKIGQDVIGVGMMNTVLGWFQIPPVDWMGGGTGLKTANMAVLVIYIVWNALPFKILVLLGGLQGVNKQYYEAAKVDGTSRFRTFWRITVPLLSPMIAYVVITSFIGGFKEYSSVVGIFGEGRGTMGRLNTMVGFIYDNTPNDQGKASAAALILFAIIFAVTMVNMYVSKKKVHY